MNDLEAAKAYIRRVGPTRVALETKLSRRTVQYVTNSRDKRPNYSTIAKILKAERNAAKAAG